MHNIATSAAVDGGIIIKLVVVGRLLFTFFFFFLFSALWRDMYSAWTKKYKLTYFTNNNEL